MIIQALAIALIILFVHACTWEGMIFGSVEKILPSTEGKWLWKPMYGCPICMTPWWGTLIYWIFFHVSILDWIMTISCAGGLSVLSVAVLHSIDN